MSHHGFREGTLSLALYLVVQELGVPAETSGLYSGAGGTWGGVWGGKRHDITLTHKAPLRDVVDLKSRGCR